MSLTPDQIACARGVERGDPERFACVMAAPLPARAVLFPLYAFNLEVARAPWVTKEPLIAQMRLQWWRDVLDEIDAGGDVRRHEVATPLACALRGVPLGPLRLMIAAREKDIERAPFDTEAALLGYLRDTGAGLAMTAAAALGAPDQGQEQIVPWAQATALIRYFQALPELEAHGKQPLPDGRPETLARLASDQLKALTRARQLRAVLGPAKALMPEFALTRALLKKVIRDPACVAEGRLSLSPFETKARRAISALL